MAGTQQQLCMTALALPAAAAAALGCQLPAAPQPPPPTWMRWSRSRARVPTVRGLNRNCPVASSNTRQPRDQMSAGGPKPASRMTWQEGWYRVIGSCGIDACRALGQQRGSAAFQCPACCASCGICAAPTAAQPAASCSPHRLHPWPHLWGTVGPRLDFICQPLAVHSCGVAKVHQLALGAQQAGLQGGQVHLLQLGDRGPVGSNLRGRWEALLNERGCSSGQACRAARSPC